METEGERYRQFTRRALIAGGAQAALFTVLAGRMYYLGVVESSQYKVLAEENRVSLRWLAPERGEIVDRFGRRIAGNRRDFRIFLVPEQAGDIEDTLARLGEIVKLSEGSLQRIRRRISRQRAFVPVTVAQNLSWDEFARINVESVNLPGVSPDAGETRLYPDGELAAHVVGYVGPVSDTEMGDDPVLQLPGFKVGKSGLERSFEDTLRGAAGDRRVEVNAYGRIVRELTRNEGEPGAQLALTLDKELQRHTVERLGEESAAVVVMDVKTGDLLVQASTPAFNPNDFNLGISHENWNALLKDPRKPLINKVLQGQYPPGSTFKMGVLLAGLEAGMIDPTEEVFCNGKHDRGDRTFHCWKDEGHGKVNLNTALAQSCDIYLYVLAERIGIDRISAMARKLGLGEAFDVGVPGQAEGLVPSREWKLATSGEPWRIGETLIVGIGQGALLATPLQLAVMTARLASGKAVRPRLIHAQGGAVTETPAFESLGLSPGNLRLVRQGMKDVMGLKGTAYASRLTGKGKYKNMSMAGKTGTSQVRRITEAERLEGPSSYKERPWRQRDHALFVAFAPADKPRYAISIIVEHGGGGASVAAPIGRDVMRKTLELDPASRKSIADSLPESGAAVGVLPKKT